MTYEAERATVECAECGEHLTSATLPSGVFEDRPLETLPEVFDRWMQSQIRQVADGFCMACNGATEAEIRVEGIEVDIPGLEVDLPGPRVLYECKRCGDRVVSTVGEALRDHPAVVSFYYEVGIDVLEEPSWRLDWLDAEATHLLAEDPLRVRLQIDQEGRRLALVVDEDLEVQSVERGGD